MQPTNASTSSAIKDTQLALQSAESNLGATSPELIPYLNTLAELHLNSNDYLQAEKFFDRSLKLRETNKETTSIQLCLSLQKLAWLFKVQNNTEQAEKFFLRSLDTALSQEPDNLELLSQVMRSLAYFYFDTDRSDKAEEILLKLLSSFQKSKTEANYQSAYYLLVLAVMSLLQDKAAKSQEFREQATLIIQDKCASGYAVDYLSLAEIINLYLNQGRLAEVKSLVAATLLENEDSVWPGNPVAAQNLALLAEFLRAQRKFKLAESVYKRALVVHEKTGIRNDAFANLALNLANMYLAQKKYSDAEPMLKEAIKARVRYFGVEHPTVASCVETYATLLRRTKRTSLANKLDHRAREIRDKCVANLDNSK